MILRLAAFALLFAVAAPAEEAADPAQPVRDLASAIGSLPQPLTEAAVSVPIAEGFDLDAIAHVALGDRVASASPEQIARLARIYARRIARETLEAASGGPPQWRISETRPLDQGGWLVTTTAQLEPDEEPEALQWHVVETAARLRVVDVLKDGNSYVGQLRRQLQRALQTRPLDVVLGLMEERYGLAPP